MSKLQLRRTVVRLGAVAIMVGGVGVASAPASYAGGQATITKEAWGTTAGGVAVDRYTLTADSLRVRILTYGGILQSIETPDRHGHRANVALGFDNLRDYETK